MLFAQLFESDFNNKKRLAETQDDYEDCSYCSGTGEGRYEGQSCSHCGGSGVEPSSNDDDVDITDDDWYDDSEEPESYYEKSLRSRGLGEGELAEFAPGGDDNEPNEEEILRQLASRWWLGTEQQMAQAQRTLETMGWEIGPDESGDEDAGVYVYRIGDDDGKYTIAFGHSELSLDEGVAEGIFGSKESPALPVVNKIASVASRLNAQNVDAGRQIIQSQTSELARMLSPQAKTGVDVIEQGVSEDAPVIGQVTGTTNQTDTPSNRSFGVMIKYTLPGPGGNGAVKVWQALETILPRDYPRVPYQQQSTKEPQARVLADLRNDQFSIVKQNIPSQDIAETIAGKFEGKGIPAEVIDGGVYEEAMGRKTDAKGRTQQQWIQAVKQKFPDARIVQAKMIDGPAHAMLPDGRKFSWTPVQGMAEGYDTAEDYRAKAQWLRSEFHLSPDEAWERAYDTDPDTWVGSPWEDDYKQGMAEAKASTAAFRASNAKRAKLNAMSPEQRKEYDKEQAEKQRKRDEARLEKERQKLAAKKKVSEADKKKDDVEPEVRDVALQRAISRAKADFPTAGSGIEALSKDFMRSQEQDQKSFDQIRDIDQQQDRMLKQIDRIDQQQNNEIDNLENQNSTLTQRLQQLQSVNSELEKKLAAMTGRRADKTPKTIDAPAKDKQPEIKVAVPKPSTATAKAKNKPAPSAMKSTAAQLAAPKATDPIAAMATRIQRGDSSIINPKQAALPFEPSDNVLEPTIPQTQQNPRFAAARAGATDVDPKYYADIAKKVAGSPEKFKTAMGGVNENNKGSEKSERPEADYGDEYQSMVKRVGQMAKQGPRKTVWDPVKRVYKTVPVNK